MGNTVNPAPTLRECPCCAGPAYPGIVRYDAATVRENGWSQDTFHSVSCAVCGLEMSGIVGFKTPEAAAEAWNRRAPTPAALTVCTEGVETFQQRVRPWMLACFGEQIAADGLERNHRFLEEALELVQACGCTAGEARQLVDYVYGRPVGEPSQEAGGVMVTLAALCLAHGLDMHAAGETELARIWTKVEAIRAKQAAKPKNSPLPGPSDAIVTASARPSHGPLAWWAETGTAGTGEGCNKPFWLRADALGYVRKHGGHIKPLEAVDYPWNRQASDVSVPVTVIEDITAPPGGLLVVDEGGLVNWYVRPLHDAVKGGVQS